MLNYTILTSKWQKTHQVLACAFICTCMSSAIAKPQNVTDGEMSLLPPYCVDTMGFKYGDAYSNTSPRASHWVGLMGKGFWNVHHYCWALINLNRIKFSGKSAQELRGARESAIADMEYVIRNSPTNFLLTPEILTTQGDVYLLLGKIGDANSAFARARELAPHYWPPYADWAAVLIKSGEREEAKTLVKNGLEHAPGSTVLRDQYLSLGGNPSEIVPISKTPVQGAAPAAAEPADTPADAASASPQAGK